MTASNPDSKPHHVCSWWQTYFFDNALRKLFYRPEALFAPYVTPDMTVLDLGCGRGYNTLGLAQLVGEGGCVIAADLSQKLLELTAGRVGRAGLADRVRYHRCPPEKTGLGLPVDFACLFWVLHELPDPPATLAELHDMLTPGGTLFLAEPKGHIAQEHFDVFLAQMRDAGFEASQEFPLRLSRVAIARKEQH